MTERDHFFKFQFPDSPIQVPQENQTILTIVKASSSVVIEKEEEAFSFGSLLADIGGVLGLFVGFNLLMIWELFIFCIKRVPCDKLQKLNVLV